MIRFSRALPALLAICLPLPLAWTQNTPSGGTLDSAALISHWADAIGGAARIGAVKEIYREAQSNEDGLVGSRREWITSDLRRRENVDHTHDQSQTVSDGKQAWLHDWNGKTQALHGDDFRLLVDLAVLHSFAALRGEAGKTESVADASNKFQVLRFHPQGGFPITLYLDSSSYLPVKAELPAFDGIETITFDDWRVVNGIKVPFTEKQQDPVNTTELRLQKVIFDPKEKASFAKPADTVHDAFFVSRPASAGVAFNFENQHILVPTMVNGIGPIWFILDTGSNYNFLNGSRLDQFHLKTYGALQTEGGANTTSGAYVESVTLRVGGVELRNQHAGVIPMNGLEKVLGVPIGGLLGYDFISRFVTAIDYPGQKLEFFDPRKFHYRGQGTAIPLLMQTSEPYLQQSITVKGEKVAALFVLDSGAADAINLTSGFVKEHNLLERAGDPQAKPKSVAGSEKEFFGATTIRGLIDEVQLGPYTLHHVIGNLSVGTHGAYASSMFSGTIGEAVYSRFSRMILDYARDRVILEPGPDLEKPFQERRSFGLRLLGDGPDFNIFRVTAVTPESPAERAGFKKGDVISSVDATPAAELSIAKLDARLKHDGEHHVFTLQRNGSEMKIDVTVTTTPVSGVS